MQLLASIVASIASWLLIQNTAAPTIGAGYNVWEALFGETLWTFFLCTTVLVGPSTTTIFLLLLFFIIRDSVAIIN
jgi:hypothetical protein